MSSALPCFVVVAVDFVLDDGLVVVGDDLGETVGGVIVCIGWQIVQYVYQCYESDDV